MIFETIFFDLDSTLYPESNGLWAAIRKRIDRYMYERMGFSWEEIPEIRSNFLTNHGTTLKGLQIHYQIDPADYLHYVHDLPLEDFLSPDPMLRDILLSIPSRRWVFTNSDSPHANRVMNILGIQGCFEGLIDILTMDPLCKPEKQAYSFALNHVGTNEPTRCALLDDSINNLIPAKELGIFTVLVGKNGSHPCVDRSIEDIHDLRSAVPEFWR